MTKCPICRLLCRLGLHKWLVVLTACGFGFDREFSTCERCPAERHVDFGVNRQTDIYSTTVYPNRESRK